MQNNKKGVSDAANGLQKSPTTTSCLPFVYPVRMRVSATPAIRKDKTGADGMASVYIQVVVSRKIWRWPLDFRWPVKHFINGRCMARHKGDKVAQDHNLIIEQALARINDIEVTYRLRQQVIDLHTLKQEIYQYESKKCFLQYIGTQIEARQKTGDIQHLTAKLHRQTLNVLKRWYSVLPFNELSVEHGVEIMNRIKKAGYSESTQGTHYKVLRIYIRRAIAEGLTKNDFLKSIKGPKIKSRIYYLSADQLSRFMQLYQVQPTDSMGQISMRLFLFSCFTGLRISDLRRISQFLIVDGNLIFSPQKNNRSGKIINVPLNSHAQKLYDELKATNFKLYAEQKMNRALNKVGIELSLPFNLSFHVARHTFATLLLEKGGNIEVLQQLLGHSNIKHTMIYSHVSDQRKREQVALMESLGK